MRPQESELPRRYAYTHASQGGRGIDLMVSVVCADDGSCWDELSSALADVEAMYLELELRCESDEVPAQFLAAADARAFSSSPRMPAAASVDGDRAELARLSAQADFSTRRLCVRCGVKSLGERNKRFAHTMGGTVRQP